MDFLYDNVSFEVSKVVTRRYSTSFSSAVSVLSKDERYAIRGIYGFVRIADEVVDTFEDIDQEKYLNKLSDDLADCLRDGVSTNPIIHAFANTLRSYDIPVAYAHSFLDSMRMDLKKKTYCTNKETEQYIYGSAEVIGLMCLKVFVKNQPERFDELEKPARLLGSAFQKVNFLRDMGDDVNKLDRNYFAGTKETGLSETRKQEIIREIDAEFRAAKKGIRDLPGKSKLAVYLAYTYYKQLLRVLRKTPSEKIIQSRIRISNGIKLFYCLRSVLAYNLRLF